MHKSIINLIDIKKEINLKSLNSEFDPKIIAVSKTFSINHILPLIDYGHINFGENKVQEAVDKWAEIKKNFQNLKLHMIGKLQTNKVKNAVALFDYIHSLDSLKLAEKISSEQNKISKKMKLFIQVNIGAENQKSGIEVEHLKNFYEKCINDFDLNIIGLMCIPPITDNVQVFFIKMSKLNSSLNLSELSMGMSSDYIDAVNNGSTFVRIGSKIFGKRS